MSTRYDILPVAQRRLLPHLAGAQAALTYFEGGDLGSLRKQVRDALTSAVAGAGPIEPTSVISRTLT